MTDEKKLLRILDLVAGTAIDFVRLAAGDPTALYTLSLRAAKAEADSRAEGDEDKRRKSQEFINETVTALQDQIEGLYKNANRPRGEDLYNALSKYREAYETAGGERKRWILFQAFYGRFNPEFYEEGRGNILWDVAVKLEYPEARYLAGLLDSRGSEWVRVNLIKDDHAEYAQRLVALRLLVEKRTGAPGSIEVVPAKLAETVRRYIAESVPDKNPFAKCDLPGSLGPTVT